MSLSETKTARGRVVRQSALQKSARGRKRDWRDLKNLKRLERWERRERRWTREGARRAKRRWMSEISAAERWAGATIGCCVAARVLELGPAAHCPALHSRGCRGMLDWMAGDRSCAGG